MRIARAPGEAGNLSKINWLGDLDSNQD